ncbi:MAG: peptide chain release factor N(5)-glutamine methyltransferase [Flavobacteriaceae bacterium]|nr:peptide chain release factor N(5)-glutamine methyltransferase [Flavobacteriaceae bacterium]
MKLKHIKEIFHKQLESVYVKEEVNSFFFMLTESYFDFSRIQLALQPDFEINKQLELQILKALEALKNHEPIQYIIGQTEFFGLPFKVNESVLIPRLETEELVDWIVSKFRIQNSEFRILDIGTGCGCIAVSLAKNLPSAKVFALDVSKEALNVAKENAELNNVEVTFFEANILNWKQEFGIWNLEFEDLEFDIIVSNPPYVRTSEKRQMQPNVLKYEPHLALFVEAEDSLLFYRKITQLANQALSPNGILYFEINEYLGKDMLKLMRDKGFAEVEIKTDIFGKNRMIKGQKIKD